jgi:hypothetical protein
MAFCIKLLAAATIFSFDMTDGKDPVKHMEVQFLPVHGNDVEHHEGHGHGHGHKLNGHGALPLQQFMKLFPLDIPANAHVRVIHIGHPEGMSDDKIADMLGDHILDSILSELSGGFHSDMKPLLAGLQAAAHGLKHPCDDEIERLCQNDTGHGHKHESELHCLGLHANELSADCSKEVQQSLPFMCSGEISHYCPAKKTIEMSVLQCLEDKADAGSPLGDDCKDSIAATRAVLTKMKTQNMAIVDKRTGQIIKSSSSVFTTPIFVTGYVLVLLLLAIVLYAFWVRDDETSFFKSVRKLFREIKIKLTHKRPPRATPEPVRTVELKSNYL